MENEQAGMSRSLHLCVVRVWADQAVSATVSAGVDRQDNCARFAATVSQVETGVPLEHFAFCSARQQLAYRPI